MRDNIILVKSKNIAARVIDDETVLMPIAGSSKDICAIFTLNKSGSVIWSLIDGKKTIGQIKVSILANYTVTPKKLKKDISQFLIDLKKIAAIKQL